MITALDRLGAAIKGEKSDRIPVFCNLLDQGASELGISLEEYYSSGEHVAEAQLRMLKNTDTTTYGVCFTSAKRLNCWAARVFYLPRTARRMWRILSSKNMLMSPDWKSPRMCRRIRRLRRPPSV